MRTAAVDELPIQSRNTRLVPPKRELVDELYRLAATSQIPWPWSGPVSPAAFEDSLWRNVLVQFGIEDVRNGRPVGYLRADNASLFHGYAFLSMVILPDYRMRGWPLEGVFLFVNYLFRAYNLHRLYAEVTEARLSQYRSGLGHYFEIEACFRDRLTINGTRQNQYVLTCTRDLALTECAAMMDRIIRDVSV
jgi:hypothetical protein